MSSSEFLAIVRLAVKGAQAARKDIETFRNGIMETGKAAGLSRKEMDALDKTISKGAASQRQAAQASKQSNDSKKRESAQTRKLREELERLNNQYRRTQQQLLGRGGNPSAAIGRFSQEELKRIVALNQVYPQYGREVAKAAREALRLAEAKQKVNQTMGQTEGATKNYGSSLPRLRYALYDVSQTAALMGVALAGIGTAVLKTAVDFERSFAEVVRTTGVTGDEVGKLRTVFEDLNTELPVSFQELAAVGKLAGQLGIPTADIENFTRLVVQFSETTGIAVEDSATAFGRLSALLGLSGDQFDNLGSSILKAGTSFVATEADIIGISTQLAGVGRQAGLTADQVVGLSTALASVGIAPELARGVITRTFGRIGQAVAAGGSRLNDFATIAGMSSEQFATAWQDDASAAFLEFTRGIAARGGQAEAALASLGITSVRDVPALLRLAQTSESILAPALGIAAEGFEEGTELADQYGIIAGTTAEQLNRLQQNVQQLFAELAKGVLVFAPAIESIGGIVKALRSIAQIPVVGFLSSMVVAATALSGVFLIALGGAIRFAASLLAVRTSLTELNAVTEGQRVTLRNLVVEAFRASTGMQKLSSSEVALSGSTFKATTELQKKNAALFQNGQLTSAIAMKEMGYAGATKASTLAVKAKTAALSTMSTVMRAIPWIFALDVVMKLTGSFGSLGTATAAAREQLSNYAQGMGEFNSVAELTELQLEAIIQDYEQTWGWIGKITLAVAGLFGQQPRFLALEELARGKGEAEKFSESIRILVDQGNAVQGLDIASEMIRQLEAAGLSSEKFIEALRELNPEIAAALEGSYGAALAVQALDDAHANAAWSAMDQADQISFLTDEMMALVDDAYAVVNAEFAMEEALNRLGEAFARNGAEVEANGKAIQDVVSLIIQQAQGDVPTAVANLQALYDTLINEGIAYASQLTTIQGIISDLLATVGADSAKLPGALTAMGGSGYKIPTPTITLTPLRDSWNRVTQEVNETARATGRVASGTREATQAAREQTKAVRETREEVVTLLDYSSDLRKVFSRSFDLRFQSQSNLDKIADTWDDIAKSAEEAEEAIRELSVTQQQLVADRSIKEYFLTVAEAYGDTLRADALRAELSQIDADIAANTDEIAKAQAGVSRELEGNSAAARENRRTITELVSQYQSYIESLAASGMSQADLRREVEKAKKEFIDQATEMGFAETQVMAYAAAFDDMTFAINNVPRNVTIEADVNPALTALRELEAQQRRNIDSANELNRAMGAAPSIAPAPSRGSVGAPQISVPKIEFPKFDFNFNFDYRTRSDLNRAAGIEDMNRITRSPFGKAGFSLYQKGGFTGRGDRGEPAGIVHRGEYVVPKRHVNQSTGLPDLSFLTQMAKPISGAGASTNISMPGSMVVELSPRDRELLRSAGASGDVVVKVDSREIARAANDGNRQIVAQGGRP